MDVWKHFAAVANALTAQAAVIAGSRDPLTRGTGREVLVREVLLPHLPAAVVIGAGEIVDSQRYVSRPVDLILYRDDVPRFALGGDKTHYLIEGVLASVEVKTNLTLSELGRALDQVAAVKRAVPIHALPDVLEWHAHEPHTLERLARMRRSPPTTIFAYRAASFRKIVERIEAREPSSWPDFICSLDQGTLRLSTDGLKYENDGHSDRALMSFFFYLVECITANPRPQYAWQWYALRPRPSGAA